MKAAWGDADTANKRLLGRTLFVQVWVLGDHIVALKPATQFAPFFRLMRCLVSAGEASGEADAGIQLLYLASLATAAEDAVALSRLPAAPSHGFHNHHHLRELTFVEEAVPPAQGHQARGAAARDESCRAVPGNPDAV